MSLISKGLFIPLLLKFASGATISQTLTVTKGPIFPDGVITEGLLFNGQFPGPMIRANLGDDFVITVNNQMDESTAVHWHGFFQNGTQFQDGPSMITQCPIVPGGYQTYRFKAAQSGSYWYHAHKSSQYTDGMVGPLIVDDPQDKAKYQYDAEIVLFLGDWYHTDHATNENFYLSTGVPPFPFSPLMNGYGQFPCLALLNGVVQLITPNCSSSLQYRLAYTVMPGKTYRVRVINPSAMSAFTFSLDGHKLRAIEVDGVQLAAPSSPVDYAYIATAQRYSFLITMNQNPAKDYFFRAEMDTAFSTVFNAIPNLNKNFGQTIRPVATARLWYNSAMVTAEPVQVKEPFTYLQYILLGTGNRPTRSSNVYLEEMDLLPLDGETAPSDYDVEYILDVEMTTNSPNSPNGAPLETFNGSSQVLPTSEPFLSTFFKGQDLPTTANPLKVNHMQRVQIIIRNPNVATRVIQHPIHLHGHTFFVVGKGLGNYDPETSPQTFKLNTVKRDTAVLSGWVAIRFVADNPGVWTMHCHIDWHNAGGMAVNIVEGQDKVMQDGATIPAEAQRVCGIYNSG